MIQRKMLLINGSAKENGCTGTDLRVIAAELEKRGVASEIIWLGNGPFQDCTGCGGCETGRCVHDGDPVNAVIDRLDEFDGMVVGSPIYYAGVSGRVCSFLDRLFYSAGDRMKGKIGAAVVNARRAGTTAGLERLELYFTISGMIIPGSSYWNGTHGRKPEDVEKDAEGMQTLRNLAKTIAWTIDSVEAAEKAGITFPGYEHGTVTDFIR